MERRRRRTDLDPVDLNADPDFAALSAAERDIAGYLLGQVEEVPAWVPLVQAAREMRISLPVLKQLVPDWQGRLSERVDQEEFRQTLLRRAMERLRDRQ